MSELDRSYSIWAKLGFAVLIASTSFDVFYKYMGPGGIIAYLAFCIALVLFVARIDLPSKLDLISERSGWTAVFVLFAFVTVAVVFLYPIANSGSYGGGGSDADDALMLGASELIHGRYPFYPLTYLGNPIAPMPGSLILAVPFVLINALPFQNIFWLAILLLLFVRELKSTSYSAVVFSVLILASPAVMLNLITSIDRLSNTIYVLTAMWLMIKWLPRPDVTWWKPAAAAVFLGVGLSSRSNFFLLMPVFFSFLGQVAGWARAMRFLSLTAASFLIVTVPFWLYDPAAFSPLHEQSGKMSRFNEIIPFASIVIATVSVLSASLFALRSMPPDGKRFLISCAVIQMFSILLLSAISSIHLGQVDLYFGHTNYGVFALIFAAFAGGIALKEAALNSGRYKQH